MNSKTNQLKEMRVLSHHMYKLKSQQMIKLFSKPMIKLNSQLIVNLKKQKQQKIKLKIQLTQQLQLYHRNKKDHQPLLRLQMVSHRSQWSLH